MKLASFDLTIYFWLSIRINKIRLRMVEKINSYRSRIKDLSTFQRVISTNKFSKNTLKIYLYFSLNHELHYHISKMHQSPLS